VSLFLTCVIGAGQYGYTALHYAAANGHFKAVDLLLKGGATASVVTKVGWLEQCRYVNVK
jgi:ankyrin repeat protein